MTGIVRVMGPEPSGLAHMLGAIIDGNIQRRPALRDVLDGPPGVVRITATDIGLSVSVELRDGTVRVWSDATAPADAEIAADSETLTGMGTVPRLGPLPHPFKAEGRAVLGKVFKGTLRVTGGARHRRLLRRLQSLLSMGQG